MAKLVRQDLLTAFRVDWKQQPNGEVKDVPLDPITSPPLCLIADECLDVARQEQLAIVLRGIVNNKVEERFLQLRALPNKKVSIVMSCSAVCTPSINLFSSSVV